MGALKIHGELANLPKIVGVGHFMVGFTVGCPFPLVLIITFWNIIPINSEAQTSMFPLLGGGV